MQVCCSVCFAIHYCLVFNSINIFEVVFGCEKCSESGADVNDVTATTNGCRLQMSNPTSYCNYLHINELCNQNVN